MKNRNSLDYGSLHTDIFNFNIMAYHLNSCHILLLFKFKVAKEVIIYNCLNQYDITFPQRKEFATEAIFKVPHAGGEFFGRAYMTAQFILTLQLSL